MSISFPHRRQRHSPHSLLEIGSAVNRPKRIRPYRLMGSINHGLGRSGQWFERRQRQPSEPGRIITMLGTVRPSDGSGYLIHHAGGR